MKNEAAFLAMALVLCNGVLWAQTEALSWVRVTERAAWKPRDSCGEMVFGGKMWLLGGWDSVYGAGLNDVWNSADGVNWTLVTPSAPWVHADIPTTLVFKDKMWIMGGWRGGRSAYASS
ncbi:MAG: hypothetical protein FJ272_19025, partial [Planctomycetes bacterium]|nr:hypothetical protein [Planctomycetota bacterium]